MILLVVILIATLNTDINPFLSLSLSPYSSCQIWSSAEEGKGAHFGGYAAEHTEPGPATRPRHRTGRPAAALERRPARPHGDVRVHP